MKTFPATEAENGFGRILDAAQSEPVTIMQQGHPIAIVLSPAEYAAIDGARIRFANAVDTLRQQGEENGLTDDILDAILNEND